MTKRDTETVKTAIDGAIMHGVSDTYELKNGTHFYVSVSGRNSGILKFELNLKVIDSEGGECMETIKFDSRNAFLQFIN